MDLQRVDRRQHLRTKVMWSTVVEAGRRRYLSRTMDVSTMGAKVRTNARLKIGTAVGLEFTPPQGPHLRVSAIVWRIDGDGLAFMFDRGIEHPSLRTTSSARAADPGAGATADAHRAAV